MQSPVENKIFISHIHEEASIALMLKDWIESTFQKKISVFVSSDDRDITPGAKWLEQIDKNLSSCDIFLVICSKSSIEKPWINFEAGAGWVKQVPLIPLCHTGMNKGILPPPYNRFQALDMEMPDFPQKLLKAIGRYIGELNIPRLDFASFTEELTSVLKSHIASSKQSFRPQLKKDDDGLSLDDEQSKVLEFIENFEDQATLVDLARTIGISDVKAQYYIDRLSEKKLIRSLPIFSGGTSYYCTSAGRKYLIENNIVE